MFWLETKSGVCTAVVSNLFSVALECFNPFKCTLRSLLLGDKLQIKTLFSSNLYISQEGKLRLRVNEISLRLRSEILLRQTPDLPKGFPLTCQSAQQVSFLIRKHKNNVFLQCIRRILLTGKYKTI